jgi:hypothetical protein
MPGDPALPFHAQRAPHAGEQTAVLGDAGGLDLVRSQRQQPRQIAGALVARRGTGWRDHRI